MKPSEAEGLARLEPSAYRDLVRRALAEDIGRGDVTTDATVPAGTQAKGSFLAKAPCVVAGVDVAVDALRQVDPSLEVIVHAPDGTRCAVNTVIADVSGSAAALLTGERTALNFLQRLSGIATAARRYVDAAGGRIIVLDTRKTTPTFRTLEKYAVRVGGASNHRFGLFDAVLIKDNHIRLAGGIGGAVAAARDRNPGMRVEVEAETMDQVKDAIRAGADIIMLDNMTTAAIREAVEVVAHRAKTEISGGVTLERMPELAASGADFVSVGALTHSAPAIDISFEIAPL